MRETDMRQLIWYRTDLRVQDNTALLAAMRRGPTLAVYLISPGQWQLHGDAPCKVDFWLRSLAQLKLQLQSLNVPMLIRHAEHWREVPAVLASLCAEHGICDVHAN